MYSWCIAFFATYNSRPDSRRRRLRTTGSAMYRYCTNLVFAVATQIDTDDTNQVLLSMTTRAIGCRYFLRPSYDKAVTGQQYRKYDIPGCLDSRSNPRLVGVFSLPFSSNARALYRGFTVAWSQSHENWVAPPSLPSCPPVQSFNPLKHPFNPAIWRSIALYRPSKKLPFGSVTVTLIARSTCALTNGGVAGDRAVRYLNTDSI